MRAVVVVADEALARITRLCDAEVKHRGGGAAALVAVHAATKDFS